MEKLKQEQTIFSDNKKFYQTIRVQKSGQYIQTTWANDTNSGRKPDTIEMRFVSGSNQTLFEGN